MPNLTFAPLPDQEIAAELAQLAAAIAACQPLARETGLVVLCGLTERAPITLTALAAACPHAPITQLRRLRRQGRGVAAHVADWLEAAPLLLAHSGPGRTAHPAAAQLGPALHEAAQQIHIPRAA